MLITILCLSTCDRVKKLTFCRALALYKLYDFVFNVDNIIIVQLVKVKPNS